MDAIGRRCIGGSVVMVWVLSLAAAFLAWVFLSHLVINHGLVVGPWIKGRTRSKGYWWPWLGRKGWSISFKPEGSLHGVLDYSARIPAEAKALRFRYRCVDVTAQEPFVAFGRMGLKMVQEAL